MSSKVYFVRGSGQTLTDKLPEVFGKLNDKVLNSGDSVAVKMHFGEPGNNAYIKPQYVKPLIDLILRKGAIPFLTDANTLYKGKRHDSKTHLESARSHGYCKETIGASVIIADGMDGRFVEKVPVDLKHFKDVSLAKAALDADTLLAITHFKGHEVTGFGGAIKNIGMGLGSKAGKQQMHSDILPAVNLDICIGDGECERSCPTKAITLKDKKAYIDPKKCIGCAECVAVCPTGAIAISWSGTPSSLQEKICEYAFGVLNKKRAKTLFFNYLIDISPNCDCYPFNDVPIVPDIGLLASADIVAIDQASVDLVNSENGRVKGNDKFKAVHPDVDWSVQLKYGEEIGLGKRDYELIKVG